MKNILFVIYTFSLGGGAERVLSDLISNLDREEYQVDILPYADYGVKQEFVPEGVTLLPSIVNMQTAGKVEKVAKYILAHFFPSVLRKRYIRKKYDIEVSFNYQIPSFLVKPSTGTKAVMWNHGVMSDLKENKLGFLLQKRSFKRATKIIAIAEDTRDSIVELYPEFSEKVEILYNGINVERISENAKAKTEIDLKHPCIVFAGRLEDAKQPLAVLEAVKFLKERSKTVFAYFMGQGEQQDELNKKIREWGLEDNAFLLGYQANPYPLFKKCDAVCMLSKSEGFPTVFAEGMVLGKPFISTPVGGVKELSDNGNCGVIVNTSKDCADAIESIVLDRAVNAEMGENCRKHITQYSMEYQKIRLQELFDKL